MAIFFIEKLLFQRFCKNQRVTPPLPSSSINIDAFQQKISPFQKLVLNASFFLEAKIISKCKILTAAMKRMN